MINLIKSLLSYTNSTAYNGLMFNLSKLFFIGKYIEKLFVKIKGFKKFAIGMAFIGTSLMKIFFNIVSLFICMMVTGFLSKKIGSYGLVSDKNLFLIVFVFLYLFLSTATNISIYNNYDNRAAVFIKNFNVRPKAYFIANFIERYFWKLLLFYPVAIFFLNKYYGKVNLLAFVILEIGLKLVFAYPNLLFYKKDKKKAEKLTIIYALSLGALSIIFMFLAGFSYIKNIEKIFFNLPALILGLVLIGLASYLLRKDENIDKIGKVNIRREDILDDPKEVMIQNNFSFREEELGNEIKARGYSEKTGIDYLSAIFFARVGLRMRKTIIGKSALFLFLGLAVILAFKLGYLKNLDIERFYGVYLPGILFFASYMIFNGENFSKFCFYNLDRPFMRDYSYRKKENIIKMIRIRLIKTLKVNFPILVALLVSELLVYYFTGGRDTKVILIVLGLSLVDMLFYSLYYIYAYFIFQPFAEGLVSRSTAYNFSNGLIYFVSYIITFNGADFGVKVSYYLASFMIAIIIVGYFAALEIAPENFKLRS